MTRYLITSALPYINGVKHLGNLVGSMLPADASARFLRMSGEEVLFICATDEHGTPAEIAAAEAGLPVEEFCRQAHEVQKGLGERFLLSFDHFGRTSRPETHEATRHIAAKLEEQGYLEERVIKQVYSVADGRFLPDRYVVGTCPNCGYERARGDQCENCTKQLDPTMLLNPRSAISGSTDLEERESRHLYLRQSLLADRIRAWLETKVGTWPVLTTSIGFKWLDEGLEDRGITRDLDWGISVDRPGFEGKVFYVWFDAPIGYIGATMEWADLGEGRDWRSWWLDDEGAGDVWYTEFMAKDNVPFHALFFPAMLMGTGESWHLVDTLKSFNWLNYYGGKFSTSDRRGVFMSDALELLPADYWRWYLLSNAPESDDTSFTWEMFGDSVNKDLVGTFGNFVNRTATQVAKNFDGCVPAGGDLGDIERSLADNLERLIGEYGAQMRNLEFRKAAATLRSIWAEGNAYLVAREPWKAIKTDRDAAAVALRTALGLIRLQGHLSAPFIPATAQRLEGAFGDSARLTGMGADLAASVFELKPGARFDAPGLLFDKIEADQLAEWVERFGGDA
ncbi:MAG: methionine--tRNA ligase [Microthrixaceae bacterium]